MEVKKKIAKEVMKRSHYMQDGPFKRAMEKLSKNKGISIQMAEKAIGLETDFVEQVNRKIRVLSLEDVIKIAKFFNTTLDAVLDRGNKEIRIVCNKKDELVFQYFKGCVETYAELLDSKGCDYWKQGLWSEQIAECKLYLERQEYLYVERYKTYMDEFERKHKQPIDVAECCDEVLINELVKRGFKVERG